MSKIMHLMFLLTNDKRNKKIKPTKEARYINIII